MQAITGLGTAGGREPHVDLRPEGVTVRLPISGPEGDGFTTEYADLAQRISAAARPPMRIDQVVLVVAVDLAAENRPPERGDLGRNHRIDSELQGLRDRRIACSPSSG